MVLPKGEGRFWIWSSCRSRTPSARATRSVWVNEVQYLHPDQPFGGHKQSGIGVEGGLDGLLEYTNTQVLVSMRWSPRSKPRTATRRCAASC